VDQRTDLPTEETIRALLHEIAPGSTVLAIGPLAGSYSNWTHLVDARAADGSDYRIVVRRCKAFGSYDRGEKARREFEALTLLQRHGIPSPEPLYLDERGALLGTPGIVTRYVAGTQVESPPDPVRWARALAAMLARGGVVSAFGGRAGLYGRASRWGSGVAGGARPVAPSPACPTGVGAP
jgi:aminoglycoside phosphotransferase (APT) family kinase protein